MNGPAPIGGGGINDYPEENLGQFQRQDSGYGTQPQSVSALGHHRNTISQNSQAPASSYPAAPHTKEGTSFEHEQPFPAKAIGVGRRPNGLPIQQQQAQQQQHLTHNIGEWMELNVSLLRHETGFGFRIVGGTEEGSQVR